MKKKFLGFLLKIFLLSLLLFGGYYFFILKSEIRRESNIFKAKKIVYQEKTFLLQHRLAFVQLAKLNPTSSRYIFAKSRIYNDLSESEKFYRDSSQQDLPDLQTIFPNRRNQYQDIRNQLATDRKSALEFYDNNHATIEEQKQFDEQVDKLFEYFPSNDFGEIDSDSDCEIIKKQVDVTKSGIDEIQKKIIDENLDENFVKVSNSLSLIAKNCQTNKTLASSAREELITNIADLKQAVFAKKMAILLANVQALEVIANQTQLVVDYDKLYDQLEALVEK